MHAAETVPRAPIPPQTAVRGPHAHKSHTSHQAKPPQACLCRMEHSPWELPSRFKPITRYQPRWKCPLVQAGLCQRTWRLEGDSCMPPQGWRPGGISVRLIHLLPRAQQGRARAEVTEPTGPLLPNRLISGAGPQDGVRVRQPGMWPHQRGRAGELTEAIPCVWQLWGQLRQKLSPGGGTGCAALRARCPQPPSPRDTRPESLGSSYRCCLDHSLSSLHPHWAAQQLVLRVRPGPSHSVSSSGPGY